MIRRLLHSNCLTLLSPIRSPMTKEDSATHSCSCTVYEMIKGSHCYTIKGYSHVKGIGPGNYISSDVFSVGGYDWIVKFYPDGHGTEEDNGDGAQEILPAYVSACVALVSENADLNVACDLSLLDQSGDKQNWTSGPYFERFNSYADFIKIEGPPEWFFLRFFEQSRLESSNYLKEDSLVIRCNLGILKSSGEQAKASPISAPPANLGHCLKEFLDSGIGYDVVFKIGDKSIKAHKVILAARSSVFSAQFFGPIGNPKIDEVVVNGIPFVVFQALLDFVYSDSFSDLNEVKSPSCSSTILVQHLLAAADLYELDRLKVLCEVKLCDELTADTVASTFQLADQHNCCYLKSGCLKFIVSNKNLGAVTKSEGFRQLEKSSPSLLSELLQTAANDSG